nr:hypothetical protein Iba_chr01dCG7380 [Ipomoea batatas]
MENSHSRHCYSPFKCAVVFWVILCVVLLIFQFNSVHVEGSSRCVKDKSVVSMATESLAAIIEMDYTGPRPHPGHHN